ncbi:MAG: AraC family transcriptional regulator [Alicyclobacillus sp.]|nr:AraC family transcriptional regulator [Alicyclobacillus sp.]HHY65695.1 AraC family transcriptional regulator [Alicyclobacillus sp.]
MADILVVDDAMGRKELRSLLAEGPYNYLSVSEADSAKRSLLLLRQERPDIVICDLSLPDMDGIEFGRKVLSFSPQTRIIGLSHLQMFETVYEAINAGFNGYLLKPIVKSELYGLLGRIVQANLLEDSHKQIRHHSQVNALPGDTSVDFGNPIDSALDYIDQHYADPISLADVAQRVYLSPSYFSRLFKAEVGVTFTEYLTQFRIQKSKILLRVTSLPVEIIATNTGFSNASYFSTTFKRLEGRTPTEYRSLFSKLQSHSSMYGESV